MDICRHKLRKQVNQVFENPFTWTERWLEYPPLNNVTRFQCVRLKHIRIPDGNAKQGPLTLGSLFPAHTRSSSHKRLSELYLAAGYVMACILVEHV